MHDKEKLKQSVMLHRQASAFAGKALSARIDGDQNAYLRFTGEAFIKEAKSAEMLRHDPTHHMYAILHRSAATLAYRCSRFREAETLAAYGLAGNPTDRLREELYDVLDRARLGSWIESKLQDERRDNLVVTLQGIDAGTRGLDYRLLPRLVKNCAVMLRNSIGFVQNYRFIDLSRVDEVLQISTNASANGVYRLGINVANVADRPMPLMTDIETGLTKLLENIELLSDGNIGRLQDAFGDLSYFNNFIGLAKEVAPDGARFTAVRLLANMNGTTSSVALDRERDELNELYLALHRDAPSSRYAVSDESTTVVGVLQFADARKPEGEVKLRPERGRPWTIVVPDGLAEDVVKPYFGDRVRVVGRYLIKNRKTRRLLLQDISAPVAEVPHTPAQRRLVMPA